MERGTEIEKWFPFLVVFLEGTPLFEQEVPLPIDLNVSHFLSKNGSRFLNLKGSLTSD